MPATTMFSGDFTAARLCAIAKQIKEAQTRRLSPLAAIFAGSSRADTARIGDVTVQFICD